MLSCCHYLTARKIDCRPIERPVWKAGSNPLRSYADTSMYEKAFAKLDLKVTVELAITEMAKLSDYVLPARSAYESYNIMRAFSPGIVRKYYSKCGIRLLSQSHKAKKPGRFYRKLPKPPVLFPICRRVSKKPRKRID